MEARRRNLILQNMKAASLRTQERNRMENRWLDRKLGAIDWTWHRKEYLLNKEIKRLEADLRITETKDLETSNLDAESELETISLLEVHSDCPRKVTSSCSMHKADRIKSEPNLTKSYSLGSGSVRWQDPTAKYPTMSQLEVCEHRYCKHFPCLAARRYTRNRFGYFDSENPDLPPVERVVTSSPVSPHAREKFIDALELESVRRPQRSSLHQAICKEHSLKKIISEMKKRSEAQRPKDWCTNYGKPTPKRKLYNAARPTSIDDFQGIM